MNPTDKSVREERSSPASNMKGRNKLKTPSTESSTTERANALADSQQQQQKQKQRSRQLPKKVQSLSVARAPTSSTSRIDYDNRMVLLEKLARKDQKRAKECQLEQKRAANKNVTVSEPTGDAPPHCNSTVPVTTTTNTVLQVRDDELSAMDIISSLEQSCHSITQSALSLITLSELEDLDAALEQEMEMTRWLDRQILEFEDNSISETVVTQTTADALLESTWTDEYVPYLLMERIRMAKSAQKALLGGDSSGTAILTQEALTSRKAMVDDVVGLQRQISETSEELDRVTLQCRQAQNKNRISWKEVQATAAAATRTGYSKCSDTARMERRILLLKRVLSDLIVGADLDLYNDARLAEVFAKLEE